MSRKVVYKCQCHHIDWSNYVYVDGTPFNQLSDKYCCQGKVNRGKMSMDTYSFVCKYIPGGIQIQGSLIDNTITQINTKMIDVPESCNKATWSLSVNCADIASDLPLYNVLSKLKCEHKCEMASVDEMVKEGFHIKLYKDNGSYEKVLVRGGPRLAEDASDAILM